MLKTMEIDQSDINDLIRQHHEMPKGVNLSWESVVKLLFVETDQELIRSIEPLFDPAFRFMAKQLFPAQHKDNKSVIPYDSFVDALPISGPASLLAFLSLMVRADEEIRFVESMRKLHQAFADSTLPATTQMIDIVEGWPDREHHLKALTDFAEKHEEEFLLKLLKESPKCRVCVLMNTMRVLTVAYGALKSKNGIRRSNTINHRH
jgi:hypothetical protein